MPDIEQREDVLIIPRAELLIVAHFHLVQDVSTRELQIGTGESGGRPRVHSCFRE